MSDPVALPLDATNPVRFLLLPEQASDPGLNGIPPRVRRYRLSRLGHRRSGVPLNPGPRPSEDYSHLHRAYD